MLSEEEKKKEEDKKLFITIFICLVVFVVTILLLDWQAEDRKNHPEKYMTYETGIIIIQPIK